VTRLRFVLASASPARLATLRDAGLDPEVVVSGVDESQVVTADPAHLATALAELKADTVAARLAAEGPQTGLLLGCDSVLELDGQVLGKPDDADDARARWRAMRGRRGVLHTGHCLLDLAAGTRVVRAVDTVVHWADVDDEEIEAYVGTGEPLHVAGAFTIDGLGGAFVERVDGDHHGVVGLSLPTLRRLLRARDVAWTDLWSAS
jgi:septum formation protein